MGTAVPFFRYHLQTVYPKGSITAKAEALSSKKEAS